MVFYVTVVTFSNDIFLQELSSQLYKYGMILYILPFLH